MLTRKLLRDWKQLMRQERASTYHLRPQDSNLHVWHLVITDPITHNEQYIMLYIYGNEMDPAIIMRCLTPNILFPINRNVSLSHWNFILNENGFHGLIQKIWRSFFYESEAPSSYLSNFRLLRAWNRIMYREFKKLFPELIGSLQQGDYEMVRTLAKKINDNNHNTKTQDYNAYSNDISNVANQCSSEYLVACDTIIPNDDRPSMKRTSSNISQEGLINDNNEIIDEARPPQKKRTKNHK